MVSTLFLLIISNIHYGDIGHNGRAGGGRRRPLPTQMNSFFVPAACLSRSTSEPLGLMQNWMCGELSDIALLNIANNHKNRRTNHQLFRRFFVVYKKLSNTFKTVSGVLSDF